MPKITTCTGYGSTGSSVVSDLMMEFTNVKSFGDFEFDFLSSVDGIRELEFGLFELGSRINTDVHIKRFINLIEYLSKSRIHGYEKWFGNKFREKSLDFAMDIIDIKWSGYSLWDVRQENIFIKFLYYCERFLQKKVLRKKDSAAKLYPLLFNKKMYYTAPLDRSVFYNAVRKYLNQLFSAVELNSNQDVLMFDQLVPTENLENYLKYFDDIRIIVVDRDPRDLYLLEKYRYQECFVPHRNVRDFVKHYELIRRQDSDLKEYNSVLSVKFEDFIYNYEKTVERVSNFLGCSLENWKFKGKHFNPRISIRNTNLVKFYQSDETIDDIKYIEAMLGQYCYRFPKCEI